MGWEGRVEGGHSHPLCHPTSLFALFWEVCKHTQGSYTIRGTIEVVGYPFYKEERAQTSAMHSANLCPVCYSHVSAYHTTRISGVLKTSCILAIALALTMHLHKCTAIRLRGTQHVAQVCVSACFCASISVCVCGCVFCVLCARSSHHDMHR